MLTFKSPKMLITSTSIAGHALAYLMSKRQGDPY